MQRMVDVGDQLETLTLYDANGQPAELDELLDRPTIMPLVRYYGCMPCRSFLHELNDVRAELDQIGVHIVAVGGAADYQARDLMDHGIAFPLLLDPPTACTALSTCATSRGRRFSNRSPGATISVPPAARARGASPTTCCRHLAW
ncbi:redoxin domain-containing protein [Kribbella sp. NPDC026596]|uniref:redoxin domain-containing protein n=1 Tax=Kribbella sp. NPDC026596 TaxID=3155122 RepID=UPI0033F423A7